MTNISKRFPGVLANDQVNLEVKAGEVHALLGENGAGKTTLMNILYGLYQPDEGQLELAGRPVSFKSPKDAMQQGIGLVAQHFHLARRHSVAENIGLGLAATPFFYPVRALSKRIKDLSEQYGLSVDPQAKVWQLSPGEQQRVEIVKALVQGAQLLILDEPTSVLTPQEAERLFDVIAQMKAEGKAVIFISHKLAEVMAIADRITVLRKGAVVATRDKAETTQSELAQLMVGRVPAPLREKAVPKAQQTVVQLKDVWVKNHRGVEALKGLTLELKSSEIVGVAGVAGNGQAELIEILTGLKQPQQGSLHLGTEIVTRFDARALLESGVAHIPEDRNHMGIVGSMSVAENLVLRQYRYPPFAKGLLLDWREVARFGQEAITSYEIATPSAHTRARLLSGGNVQKVILARELSLKPKLIVAAHPTYGLDVSAAALTHNLLVQQRDAGASILLVSEDLDELLKLSDRIAVLYAGKVSAVLEADKADREQLGLMMAGVSLQEDAA